jgi:lauroyl/myristoyl acyltransferase
MDLDEYIIKRNDIINSFDRKAKLWHDDLMLAKFNIVSACLSNYLPHIRYNEHEKIFKNIFLHQQLSIFEQSFYDLPDYVVYENMNAEIRGMLEKGGSIICTFHTGSYRLINLFLAKHKIPFSLVLSKEAMETQGESFKSMFIELNKDSTKQIDLKLIDAESPTSALQMIKDIKKGRNLVIYVDGNTGAGAETSNNQNHCNIDFLNQKIFARQGVGFLAHMLQAPVLTVASFRKSISDIRLRFYDPIFPDKGEDKVIEAKRITKNIFNLVAPLIKEYPEQWDAWFYLHKVSDVQEQVSEIPKPYPASNDKLIFNSSSFGIFKIIQSSFLFKKSNYKSYKISNQVYTQLIKCTTGPVKRKEINIPEFGELYKNNVLVNA